MIGMNAFTAPIALSQQRLEAIDRWLQTFDDHGLRRDCPSSYHEELLRQADEMDRLRLIDWEQWRDLRRLADSAFLQAVAGADYHSGAGFVPLGPGTTPIPRSGEGLPE